jgi:uncharacterized lipoprotein NlpE involved in copper resistance
MKKSIFLMICAATMALSGCKSKQNADTTHVAIGDNTRNSLDWAGTYIGIIPCADCSGIVTRVTLNQDGTYSMSQKYEDHEGVYENKGKFNWNVLGNTITLSDLSDKLTMHFIVGENKIILLDQEGKEIKGKLANNYILVKVDPALAGRKWKLTELAGKKVESRQDAYIILDAASNSVNGSLGCNNFTGFYDLKIGNRIKLSNLIVTQKMCPDMEIEDGLKNALEMVDSYNVSDDKLILNRARMAPLAVFVPAG